jgi:hypothetical protein
LRTANISFVMSVRMQELGSNSTEFREILYWEVLMLRQEDRMLWRELQRSFPRIYSSLIVPKYVMRYHIGHRTVYSPNIRLQPYHYHQLIKRRLLHTDAEYDRREAVKWYWPAITERSAGLLWSVLTGYQTAMDWCHMHNIRVTSRPVTHATEGRARWGTAREEKSLVADNWKDSQWVQKLCTVRSKEKFTPTVLDGW